ncbi:hypothetical protein AKJ40_03450 [candidate division MSBL1 archaeon SCGC-AAA259M10]|uniref:Uncharacterized protein n=1 Tax=candidate division MSBL1 archaeon SCGC-AAA259M10 TaxID=1698270 RepID=A0A133UYP8_9EURY|nr:hypothetical protein AKJ40_03450 [candidate division MSBL1 archaeon SCGC-AAA259M10]
MDFLEEKDIEISLDKLTCDFDEGLACPGAKPSEIEGKGIEEGSVVDAPSRLKQWPVQLRLVPTKLLSSTLPNSC